jgi:putative transposase
MELSKVVNSRTGKPYPMLLVLKVAEYSSATWYKSAKPSAGIVKKGPKPFLNDDQALEAIKDEIKFSLFHSEGYIKITKRLANKGKIIGKHRVNRLLRENNLLSPVRPVKQGARTKHEGTIKTDKPNILWATDGKQFYTEQDGKCWLFSVIDHFNDEILGFHVCKNGDRFAAMEPVRQAVRKEYGSINAGICKETHLALRSDHGTQYDSKDFVKEMKFLGLTESKAFVRSPECNGIIERWHRTINEQVFAINAFDNIENATKVITKFIQDYNQDWMLHRLKLKTPKQIRNTYNNKLKKCA